MTQNELDVPQLVLDAVERTKDHLTPTPLEFSRYLSDQIEGEVWLKMDCMQRTASFKFRGACNKVMSLSQEEIDKGVVAASTGNYALAVAEAVRIRGGRATIYVGNDLDQSRLGILRSHGLDIIVSNGDAWAAEREARRVGDEEGKIYVSPYNDPLVIGGQGTCGYEISKQLPDLDAAFFACGAGGLLSGSSGWLKSISSNIKCYGVSPENSPVMHDSVKAGKMLEMETFPTLADTCGGGVDLDSITLELCRRHVDEMMLLTEAEIEYAVRILFFEHRLVVEGSSALGVGGLLKRKDELRGKKIVAAVCGRNIDLEVFKRIIA
mgnify:CR=1 FL=1